MIKFKDKQHEDLFFTILNKMRGKDDYHTSLAYLLSLDVSCREHITDIYNFDTDSINPECLKSAWQTSGSLKTCRLAFNLWNGFCSDGETYIDEQGREQDLTSPYYVVDEIFCTAYAPYFWQAIKLRYPQYIDAAY